MPASKSKASPLDKAVDAALKLCADHPWQSLTLSQIANEAGLALTDLYDTIDKSSIADAIEQRLDLAAAAEPVDETDTPRERLFDVTMLRIEAMETNRDAMLALRDAASSSPSMRVALARQRLRSAKWILTCAHLDETGLEARALVFSRILARAEKAWRKDLDRDFAKTMAALDRDLRDAESWLKRIRSWKPGRSTSKEDPPSEAADTVS